MGNNKINTKLSNPGLQNLPCTWFQQKITVDHFSENLFLYFHICSRRKEEERKVGRDEK